MSNFGGRLPKENSYDIVSKSFHWFSGRSHLQLFPIYSSGGHLVNRAERVEPFW